MKIIKHLNKILIHKFWVFYYSCKLGIPWRGLLHDISKFSPIEFIESIKYYQGNSSPITDCKKDKGYSLAWQHHKGRNPHHYQYWIDITGKNIIPIKIPFKYVLEMVCDYFAAARTYSGKIFTYQSELEWWNKEKSLYIMHEDTKELLSIIFLRAMLTDGKCLNKKFVKELKQLY